MRQAGAGTLAEATVRAFRWRASQGRFSRHHCSCFAERNMFSCRETVYARGPRSPSHYVEASGHRAAQSAVPHGFLNADRRRACADPDRACRRGTTKRWWLWQKPELEAVSARAPTWGGKKDARRYGVEEVAGGALPSLNV